MTAERLCNTLDMSREDWLLARKSGIGGSDASAIVGLNPYSGAFQVYCDKLDLLPEQEDNEAMRQGRDFEDYVAKRFEEATGKKVRRMNSILVHPKHAFLLANVDRLVVGEKAGLECKTTSVYNRSDFSAGEVPPAYYVQCQHYMLVTGYDVWYLAVLVLNKGFHWFRIERNEEDIKALMQAEIDFWRNHIEKQIPPDPDGSDRATEVIKQLYPRANDLLEAVPLHGKEKIIEELLQVKENKKAIEIRDAELSNILKAELKGAEQGFTQRFVVNWKNRQRTSVDTKLLKKEESEIYETYLKSTEYRVLEIKEDK